MEISGDLFRLYGIICNVCSVLVTHRMREDVLKLPWVFFVELLKQDSLSFPKKGLSGILLVPSEARLQTHLHLGRGEGFSKELRLSQHIT